MVESRGSGYGKTAMENETQYGLNYGGSDSLLTDANYQQFPDLQMFPAVAG